MSSLPPFFSEFIYRIVNRQDQAITHRIRLYSTPVQLWLSTTDPSDIEMRKERTHALVEQGVEQREAEDRALRALAKEYPYGSKYVLEDDD